MDEYHRLVCEVGLPRVTSRVPDTPATSQVMLGTTLRERDDTYPVLPASKARVTQEERFDFSFCGAPQPSKIRLVKAFRKSGRDRHQRLYHAAFVNLSSWSFRLVHLRITTTRPPGGTSNQSLCQWPSRSPLAAQINQDIYALAGR
jgi:hypothetical protein